jgi:DUF1680 family protein
VQKTEYPWKGAIAITLHPEHAAAFSVHVRIPNRATSKLYTETPAVSGLKSLKVNGHAVTPHIERGYAVITRHWEPGDTIELELPMEPQRVKADPRIMADVNRVALRYGPLIYNVETADQADLNQPLSDAPLKAEWRPDLLGGVVAITGTWQDGTPMLAVPNYVRMNRAEQPKVETAGESSVNYAPGTSNTTLPGTTIPKASADGHRPRSTRKLQSAVWMTNQA